MSEKDSPSSTTAEVRNRSADRDINLTGGSGELSISALHTAAFNSRVRAISGGLFAGAGATISNTVTSTVEAAVGDDVTVYAKDIDVSAVNRDFAQRVHAAAKKDANVNALVNLDCFATLVPMTVDSVLEQTRDCFGAHLR